jgi:hypothetical protein
LPYPSRTQNKFNVLTKKFFCAKKPFPSVTLVKNGVRDDSDVKTVIIALKSEQDSNERFSAIAALYAQKSSPQGHLPENKGTQRVPHVALTFHLS